MAVKKKIGIGLIGSGFMGKTHALGYTTAARVFDLPFEVDLAVLADANAELADKAGRQLGFRRSTGTWRDLLDDPEVQVVNITTPSTLHREMALAALAAITGTAWIPVDPVPIWPTRLPANDTPS